MECEGQQKSEVDKVSMPELDSLISNGLIIVRALLLPSLEKKKKTSN